VANKKRRNKKLRRMAAAGAQTVSPIGGADLRSSEESPATQQGSVTPLAAQVASQSVPTRRVPGYAGVVAGPRKGGTAPVASTIDIEARVPYFTSDLRRIAITGAIMTALIVAASFFIH
jgi:hypothetical protein